MTQNRHRLGRFPKYTLCPFSFNLLRKSLDIIDKRRLSALALSLANATEREFSGTAEEGNRAPAGSTLLGLLFLSFEKRLIIDLTGSVRLVVSQLRAPVPLPLIGLARRALSITLAMVLPLINRSWPTPEEKKEFHYFFLVLAVNASHP